MWWVVTAEAFQKSVGPDAVAPFGVVTHHDPAEIFYSIDLFISTVFQVPCGIVSAS